MPGELVGSIVVKSFGENDQLGIMFLIAQEASLMKIVLLCCFFTDKSSKHSVFMSVR